MPRKSDLQDASYPVYRSPSRSFSISMSEGMITLSCQDFGPASTLVSHDGSTEYEFFYDLTRKGTARFLQALRQDYGEERELGEILKEAFGVDQGPGLFRDYCKKLRIQVGFDSW